MALDLRKNRSHEMNLTLYFRLICTVFFQKCSFRIGTQSDEQPIYNKCHFFCPKVYAMDGFNVSLQIHAFNYCSSENGYRELGHTWETVEFGFPSEDDVLLHKYSEGYGYSDDDKEFNNEEFSSVGTVGRIPVSVLEHLFAKHGGIDWEKTISIDAYNKMVNKETFA